ncbi:MAG: hypothetical protein ACKVQA_07945 [Burkholderiales bacterium]
MIKKHGLAAITAMLVSASAFAELMQNEPANFNGVVWHDSFESVGNNMTILRDEGVVKYYKRDGDAQKIGRVDAIKVAYRFYKGKFTSGVVQTYGGANSKDLLSALSATYGPPVRPRKRIPQYFWDGEKVFIVLTCEVTSYCVVEISSKELIQLEQAETGNDGSAHKKDDD